MAAAELPPNIQQALLLLAAAQAIGLLPPNFNNNLSTYDDMQIFELIIFYNNEFGILPNDTLLARVEKLRSFLADC